jgi:hypothetical protein
MHKHQARASLVTNQLAVLLFKGSGRSVVDGGHCALLVQVCVGVVRLQCLASGGGVWQLEGQGEGQLQRGTHDMMAAVATCRCLSTRLSDQGAVGDMGTAESSTHWA